eukprot:gene8944-biopygen3960
MSPTRRCILRRSASLDNSDACTGALIPHSVEAEEETRPEHSEDFTVALSLRDDVRANLTQAKTSRRTHGLRWTVGLGTLRTDRRRLGFDEC